MVFTEHAENELQAALQRINDAGMIEFFDAFLAEYARSQDLAESLMFAACEWDC